MTSRFAHVVCWPIAALLASMSVAGISVPGIYANETTPWIAQAVGQDWFDLVVVVPWLVLCGARVEAGSYRWNQLLAGSYAYVVYELFIYTFAVHFNALFFIYCATLGLSSYALIGLCADLASAKALIEPIDRRSARLAGGWLVAIGVLFGALWLAEDVPAVLAGTPSPSLAETGLFTNPVHVIDLSLVLPAHIIAGTLLWQGRVKGAVYGPILLSFGVLMSASIAGMLIAIALAGGSAPGPVIGAMLAVALVTAAILWRVAHRSRVTTWR